MPSALAQPELQSSCGPSLLSESNRQWRLLYPLILVLGGCAALCCDLPIERWFLGKHCPADLMRLFQFAETYAHGFGVTAILLTAFVLDKRRYLFPRVVAIVAGASLSADLLKLIIARTRPHAFVFDGTVFNGNAFHGTVWDTFGMWFPWGHMTSAQESFPSGHMAAATGLTAVLIWLYPRGRWPFVLFAALAGCQRMASGSHFLSDVLWGAAIASVPAVLLLPRGLLSPPFDRLEKYLAARGTGGSGAASPSRRPSSSSG
jgi:membrane-associated phospholipid phosphatase